MNDINKEYWQSRWKEKDIKFNQETPNPFLIKYIEALNLPPHARIFVPLCGKSIDMLWLLQQRYQVVGVEINVEACQEFYNEHKITFQEKQVKNFRSLYAPDVHLLAGDFFDLDKNGLGKIDAVYDRAALVALPADVRVQYAEKMIHLCEKNTQILLSAGSYDHKQMEGPPFSVDEQEIFELYSTFFQIEILYNESAEIPPHLYEKGLRTAKQTIYRLFPFKMRNPRPVIASF